MKGICPPSFPCTVWSWHWSEVNCCYNRTSLSHRQRTAELSAVESKLCLLPQGAQVIKAHVMETRTALWQFPAPSSSLLTLPKIRPSAQPTAEDGWLCWQVGFSATSPLCWAMCCQGAVSFLICIPSSSGAVFCKTKVQPFSQPQSPEISLGR